MPWMQAAALGISGLSALAGLFSNRKKKIEQESTTTQSHDSRSTPDYDPATLAMRNTLMDSYLNRISGQDDFASGYSREGLSNINQGSQSNNRAIENILASRGLSGTSAGISSLVGNRLNQGQQQASFLNRVPLLMDERAGKNLAGASSFFNTIPVGTHTTGTSTSTTKGSQTDPGNPLGGAFSSLATTLGGLYGAGAFSKNGVNPYASQNLTSLYGPR